ncbi:MAG: asparagine synthase (glutamine-hydrolyzing) [Geminicoccaceae bacterium]
MCGIAGVVMAGGRPVPDGLLKRMAAALAHRGPDGDGFFTDGPIGLAHRRLSIIDVAGGAQPIEGPDGRTRIIANGEIYNFRELQAHVRERGEQLRSNSDSETALHAYLEHGLGFTGRLHGMYALAIHDDREHCVVLARDPFGIKPLYLARTPDGIAFASEPQALTQTGWLAPELDACAAVALLDRQFVAGRRTLLRGIERVAPGEILVLRDGRIAERHRHTPDLEPPARLGEAAALAEFERLFAAALTSHLQSEVPLGVFLSGGIDSSALCVQLDKLGIRPETFTIGFASDTVSDERQSAEALATRLAFRQHSVVFDEADFWRYLPIMARACDDLIADYAALPLLKLSEVARERVTVVLSGEGGDELFAGYGRYRSSWFDRLRGKGFRAHGTLDALPGIVVAEDLAERAPEPAAIGPLSPLQQRQRADIADWLPDDLLLKVDRCLMAYGLEGRVPFLDDHLAGFAFALPDRLKVRGRHGKWLVKRWLEAVRGDVVWQRKRGFTVPIRAWLDAERARLAPFLLANPAVVQLCDRARLVDLLARPLDKHAAALVFRLTLLALWYAHHIEQRGDAAADDLFAKR